ncbi:26S proteasome non-ATPase regulatory subunit 5-like [Saccoglossus kowalevskii]|uniref:26S proteasome non-ATPase regulatory subunit 5 n=1 Tax=Saccoglossus kowalevskii TaxID=10224 RepID=A0ABM0M8Z0_SACKO|nr:PREDICTED: 26S proteasome non-ATPase regulatory subunit 5-like [Saccoglossus kowalevskii]
MATVTTINGLLGKLTSSPGERVATLEELRTALGLLHPRDLDDVVPNLSLQILFQCMQEKNRDEAELSKEILKRLFAASDPCSVITQYKDEIYSGIKSESVQMKELCLLQVYRCASTEKGRQELLQSSLDILYLCVQCLADKEISVGKEAGRVLKCLGESQAGLEFLFQGNLLDKMKSLMKIDDVIRYRVYEVAVDIFLTSPQAIVYGSNSGIITQLISELERDDILIQMNCIEMLSTIASCQHGLQYLDQQGIVGKVESIMVAAESDPLVGFLMPGLIKFFGSIARYEPSEVFEKHPLFVRTVFTLLTSSDLTQKGVAIDTVGIVGSTVAGKLVLHKQGKNMIDCMRVMGSLVQQPPTEMRIRTLESIAALLHVKKAEQTEDILSLTERWFLEISSKPMDTMFGLCNQPFGEIRGGAFLVLQSIGNQPWGQRQMNDYPGFTEYILDRSTESEKLGKELKFDIVKVLVESPTTADIFGRPYLLRLKEYLREGPFYVKVQSEVAMEGDG